MGERRHRVRSVTEDGGPDLVHAEVRVGPPEKLRFTANDGPGIKGHGVAFRKVGLAWAIKVEEDFEVETNEGTLCANAGDYVAYDERSGHVWPVAASYVLMNYEQVGMEPVTADTPSNHVLYQALEALSAAARHLSATDVANAEVNLAEPRYRPLTQLCAEAAALLQAHLEATVGLATGENAGAGADAQISRFPTREEHRKRAVPPPS